MKPTTRTKTSCIGVYALAAVWLATGALLVPVDAASAAGGAAQSSSAGTVADGQQLANASSARLLQVYAQLRNLQGGDKSAITENVAWKRAAATFAFKDGKLTFAAPVAGRVVAAVFDGHAVFQLDPPTAEERHQIARYTKSPNLAAPFTHAVFFFTDDSWGELQKLLTLKPLGDVAASGKAIAATETRYQRENNAWWANERKRNFTMQNLAARMLADLTDPSSQGLFLGDVEGDRYGHLIYEVSWNRKLTLLPEIDNDEEVMLLRQKSGQFYEWLAGFHLGREYASSPRPEHVMLPAHCEDEAIDATVSKSNRLSASAQMHFTVSEGTPRLLPVTLSGVLRVSAITDEAGKPVAYIQEDRALDSDLWLILPEPAATRRTYSVTITYAEDSTSDSRVIDKMGEGLFFVGERETWYPSFGSFEDRTNFKLHFLSPKNYRFVATGRLVDSKKEKTGWTSDYVSQIPFSVVGFNYGDFVDASQSDPKLTVTAYAGKSLPDELTSLEARLDIAQMARGPGAGDIDDQYGILRGGFNTASGAKYAAAKSYQAFRLYQAYFGPLPFGNVSVTEQPVGFFGQSFPTLIYLPYLSLLDKTTLNSLRLQSTEGLREFFDIVAVHEMSHQWWGHMVGWKTYHDQWLSEGFAEFSAALYLEAFERAKLKDFWDLKRRTLLSKDSAGHRPVDVGPLWLNFQTDSYLEPSESFDLRYDKGAYVLWMLRLLMRQPRAKVPDGRFIAMMHDFVETYEGKNASTEDFERIAEKHAGQPLDWFFNEWVYGDETPVYDFSYQLSSAPQGKTRLHLSLAQSEVSSSFRMLVPVYVYVRGEPHFVGYLTVTGAQTATGDVLLPLEPEKVAIDVDHSLLAVERQ